MKWPAALALGLVVFALHLRSMAPTITAGDSAELSAAQATLGVAHAPGYPLYVLSGKAFASLIPYAHPAYRSNLFSAFCGFLLTLCLFFLMDGFSGSLPFSAAAVLAFHLIPGIEDQFLSTEVFGLNSLWAAALLAAFVLYLKQAGKFPFLYLSLFLFGLGMGNQHTLILLAPGFAALLAWEYLQGRLPLSRILIASGFFLAGFSIYLYLPIRSLRDPLLDWEDPETFRRFWGVLTRARYGTFQLAQGTGAEFSMEALMKTAAFLGREMKGQLGILLLPLLLIGSVASWTVHSDRRSSALLLLGAIFTGPVFFLLTRAWKEPSHEVVLRFLPLFLLIFFIWGAAGLSHLRWKPALSFLFLAAAVLLWSGREAKAQNGWLYDSGRNVLKTLPPGSLLFCDRADETEFALAYFLYAEGARPDLEWVDCNASVTRSIYGEDYYEVWGKPRLARREIRESEMIARRAGPVYYATVEPEMIPSIPKAQRGILYQAKPLEESTFPWDEFYCLRADWSRPGLRGVPYLSNYLELMGRSFAKRSDWKKAQSYLSLFAVWTPGVRFNHSVGLLFLQNGQPRIAQEFLMRAIPNEPEKDKILCNLGIAYEKLGSDLFAEESYRAAAKENPQSFQPHYNLGVLYWKQKRWREVAAEFEAVLRLNPAHADAERYLKVARTRI